MCFLFYVICSFIVVSFSFRKCMIGEVACNKLNADIYVHIEKYGERIKVNFFSCVRKNVNLHRCPQSGNSNK